MTNEALHEVLRWALDAAPVAGVALVVAWLLWRKIDECYDAIRAENEKFIEYILSDKGDE